MRHRLSTFRQLPAPVVFSSEAYQSLYSSSTVAPALISGVLRQGHKMLLAGPSKAGKSFALIELALCLASGKPWLGRFECAVGKVLYVNLEVDRASCIHRFI